MMTNKKSYIIVDEYNRWLGTGYDATPEEIEEDIKDIRKQLAADKGDDDIDLLLFEINGKPIHV
jgi:hypothetical protein